MTREITISEAREGLTSLPRKLAKAPGAVTVTRRGTPVLAIMPWELYEAIMETLDILGDEELSASIREGIKDIREGRTISTAQLKKELEA